MKKTKRDTKWEIWNHSTSGGSKICEKGEETIISPRPHLSKMHTTIYMPFTRKRRLLKKNQSQ